ncbi:MAG: hypothetical protein ABSH31_10785 [Bryobacteraceae bacterium]
MPDCSNQYALKYSRRAARTALIAFVLFVISRAFAQGCDLAPGSARSGYTVGAAKAPRNTSTPGER